MKTFVMLLLGLLLVPVQELTAQSDIRKQLKLKGLRLATKEDMKGSISIPPTTPSYDQDGQEISLTEVRSKLKTGNYHTDFFLDKNDQVQARIIRISTPAEIENRRKLLEKLANDGMMETNLNPTGKTEVIINPKPSNEASVSSIETNGDLAKQISRAELAGPKTLQNFEFTCLSGQSYNHESLKGKVVVFNFWFIECKPCVAEIPMLNKLVRKYSKDEVVFLAPAINNQEALEKFLSKNRFRYEIGSNMTDLMKKFEISFYPTHMIVDQSGQVVEKIVGLGDKSIKRLEETIQSLLP